MLIFGNTRGKVARVEPTAPDEIASLSFPTFDYESLYAIISANQLKFAANHQVMDTIGGDVYLTSFGEAMTPVSFSGAVFSQICEETPYSTGPERLMRWWQQRNLSRRREPVVITYGFDTAIRGFIVSLDIAAQNARDRLWTFNLVMLKIPFRPEIEDSRFADASADIETTPTEEPAALPAARADRLDVPVTFNATLSQQTTPRVLTDPLS